MVVMCRLLCYRMLLWFLLDFTHSRGKYKSNSLCSVCCMALRASGTINNITGICITNIPCKWKPITMTRKTLFFRLFLRTVVCKFLFLFFSQLVALPNRQQLTTGPSIQFNSQFFPSLQLHIRFFRLTVEFLPVFVLVAIIVVVNIFFQFYVYTRVCVCMHWGM